MAPEDVVDAAEAGAGDAAVARARGSQRGKEAVAEGTRVDGDADDGMGGQEGTVAVRWDRWKVLGGGAWAVGQAPEDEVRPLIGRNLYRRSHQCP